MIYARLLKEGKLIIKEQERDGNELESFALLKISLKELLQLLNISKKENMTYENDHLIIKYSNEDEVQKSFKAIANEHRKRNPHKFLNVNKQFNSKVEGTSVLLRDPDKHIIWVAKKRNNPLQNINRVCVSNEIRNKFFKDVVKGKYYSESGKFIIDTRDYEKYSYWSNWINISFLEQLEEFELSNIDKVK